MNENRQNNPQNRPETGHSSPGPIKAQADNRAPEKAENRPQTRPYHPRLLVLHVDFFDLLLEESETM